MAKKTFIEYFGDVRNLITSIFAIGALIGVCWSTVAMPQVEKKIDTKIEKLQARIDNKLDKLVKIVDKQTHWNLFKQRNEDPKVIQEFEKEYRQYKSNEVVVD